VEVAVGEHRIAAAVVEVVVPTAAASGGAAVVVAHTVVGVGAAPVAAISDWDSPATQFEMQNAPTLRGAFCVQATLPAR